MKKLLLLALFALIYQYVWSQCTITSSNGSVVVSLTPKKIIPATLVCPFGYDYKVEIGYDITFVGTPTLYFLNGNINCGGTDLSFTLPITAGSGTVETVSNYTPMTNCVTVTPASLSCNTSTITFSGLGLTTSSPLSCALLPVDLVYFKANPTDNGFVNLSWQTALELNNDFFTVESSRDGEQWIDLAKIKGAGTTILASNYNFVDERPRSAIAYYRLKQTDFDGQSSYSKVIAVNVAGFQNPEVNVYPNPTMNQVTIEADESELEEFSIYNLLGQDVSASIKTLSGNDIKRIVDLSNLDSGTYFIKTKTTAKKVNKL